MKELIAKYRTEIQEFVAKTADEAEDFRIRYLSKKGIIPGLFAQFKHVDPTDRKEIGKLLNELKTGVQEKIQEAKSGLEEDVKGDKRHVDLTLSVNNYEIGSRHPVSLVREEMIEAFTRIGFTISEGPEIEDDWHNFTALNFPPEHPARDMQDTFFIQKDPDIALRTHTSSVQVRVMENSKPPIRTISPGRVFRHEAISARAHVIFHQIEGLYIDKNVSFADLRQTLLYFAREFFGEDTEIRLRPSYFPFTEPSGEMDISCNICGGEGCPICKYTGWVEVLGCGMVDPNVLDNCGIDPNVYSGYAFGIGVERTALVKHQINDLRLFYENDMRFLKQFRSLSY